MPVPATSIQRKSDYNKGKSLSGYKIEVLVKNSIVVLGKL